MRATKEYTLAQLNRRQPDDTEMPEQPEPPKLGNADKLLERIRSVASPLLFRPNFVLLHERGCTSERGGLCDCDATAAVDGHVLRLRD